jgi:SWI/SNF-related matrix-associated actin-dependent regulator of chromatin subfamily A3
MIKRRGVSLNSDRAAAVITDSSSVVFSFWTSTLDVVGTALERQDIPYARIDGNLSYTKRNAALKTFRENCAVRVALLTISCGAVGLVHPCPQK